MTQRLEFLSAAFAALDEAIFMIDRDERICELNPAAARLVGCEPCAACGLALDELIRFRGQRPAPDEVARSVVIALPRSNSRRVVMARATSVRNAAGELLGQVVILQPDLAGEAAVWQRLVDHSDHLSCVVGIDGRIKQVNRRWTEILGYEPEEALGRLLTEFIHPDDHEATIREARRLAESSNTLVAFENRYRCKRGDYRWLAWYAVSHVATSTVYGLALDITTLKRQEQLLHETQSAAHVGGWELDLDTRALYWTDETYRLHETSPAEYTPTIETAIAFYAEDSRAEVSQLMERAIREAEPFEVELPVVTARGRRIWCRVLCRVVVDDGRVTRLYGSFQDITEHRRVQQALLDSEQWLRSLVHDIPVGLVVHGSRSEILQCNQAALDALGLTMDQILGKTSFDEDWNVIHEDGSPFPGAEHPSSRALSTGQSVTGVVMGVYRPRTRDRVWLMVNAVVQPDAHGDVRSVAVSFTDITDRKRAEDAARENHAMFRAVYDHTGVGVLLRSPRDGALIECNRTFERMMGLSSAALRSRGCASFVYPDDNHVPAEPHAALLDGRRESYELDRRYVRADGSILWGHVTVSVVRDQDGSPRYLVEMVIDITDRKRMESQLLLADRLASLGTMAAGVAHEINNPLTWLMGNVSFAVEILDELRPGMRLEQSSLGELRGALTEAISGAERVRTIVQDLKMVSRIEESPDATADLGRVISTTTRMLHNELSHRARLVLDIDEVPKVVGDEARLGQVLTNLVVNAIQALPDRERDDNLIRVRARRAGGGVMVEVIDNGVGISPELQLRIFDPFFTTKDVGEGTGLGLSICHSIVASLGGRIEVDSTPGQGTTFRIWLRVAGSEVAAPEQRSALEAPRARKRILCIDDEPDVGRLVARFLRKHHDVTFETDGTQALERLRAGERYDAIVCDLMMPSMSGMDFYRELCAITPELAEHCGFVTGGVFTPAARAFAAELPASRLIEKPFRQDAFHAFVGRLVG